MQKTGPVPNWYENAKNRTGTKLAKGGIFLESKDIKVSAFDDESLIEAYGKLSDILKYLNDEHLKTKKMEEEKL